MKKDEGKENQRQFGDQQAQETDRKKTEEVIPATKMDSEPWMRKALTMIGTKANAISLNLVPC